MGTLGVGTLVVVAAVVVVVVVVVVVFVVLVRYVLWSSIADAATHIVCAVAAANEGRLLVLSLLMMLRIDIGLG